MPAVLPASGAGAGAAALPVVRGITGSVEYSANAKSNRCSGAAGWNLIFAVIPAGNDIFPTLASR